MDKNKKKIFIRNRRMHNQILAMGFIGVIILCLVISLAVKDRSYSESENRNLAQWPAFSVKDLESGDYFSNLSDYFSDQFAGRDGWITLNLLASRAIGEKEEGTTYLCKSGYLMAEPDTPDTDALKKTTTAINTFAREHTDLNYYVMVAPAAANVISQYLPANAPVRDQVADIHSFYTGLDSSITTIDVNAALSAHTDEYIFYKTDHHWTSLGASYAFKGAAADLGITDPVTNYTVYTVADDFQGTLSSKSGSHFSKDAVQLYVPETDVKYYVNYTDSNTVVASMYSSSALETKDKYTVFFGGNHPLVEIRTTADTGRNLLIFKDSYANSFVQFLTPYFDRIVMVDPRYYYDDVETALTSYNITDVLYLYSGNTLVTDKSLADVLN